MHPTKPVAVVVARWEFEAWFLTSLETVGMAVGIPEGTAYEGNDVESEHSAKGWIEQRLPPGRKYSETRDQVRMTHYLDLALAESRSRSSRRLKHALEQLIEAYLQGEVTVTPLPHVHSEE